MSSSRSGGAAKRLTQELKNPESKPELEFYHPVSDADLMHWEAVMRGVPGTPYEGGLWKLDIQIPEKYPNGPPTVKFVTPVCHPNVNFKTGEICLDLLKDKWTPQYTIASTLGAIHQMLSYPEPDSPLNVDIAVMFRNGDLIGAESLIRYCCSEWRWDGRPMDH